MFPALDSFIHSFITSYHKDESFGRAFDINIKKQSVLTSQEERGTYFLFFFYLIKCLEQHDYYLYRA